MNPLIRAIRSLFSVPPPVPEMAPVRIGPDYLDALINLDHGGHIVDPDWCGDPDSFFE